MGGLGIAGKALGAAGLVAAAGYGGYQLGSKVISPLIDKGLSAITGKDTTLGGSIYDAFHTDDKSLTSGPVTLSPEANARIAAKKKENADIVAKKSQQSSTVSAIAEKKDTTNEEKASAPIIINNNTTGGSSQLPQQATPALSVNSSIRNQDSTYERVQMEDFWPRVK